MSVLVVLSSLLLAVAAVPDGVLDSVGDNLKKETSALTSPVFEKVSNFTSSNCDIVKKLFGVNYEQMEKKEPDLNKLELDYVSYDLNMSMNINSVVELLPKFPNFNHENFIIYFHGFTDNPRKESAWDICNGFINKGLNNILALDSSPYIGEDYPRSTTYVKLIGNKVGGIITQLVKDGLPPKSIHLIGHSLGAHIAGFTAKQFKKESSNLVGRVTLLDAAGPCFAQIEGDDKLSPNDAEFVMAIHTSGGVVGLKEPLGHADFYPNEGVVQAGCGDPGCDHARAWQYYAEALPNDKAFLAELCDSWDAFKKGNCSGTSYMGITTESSARGKYYLQTANDSPYGLGKRGASYEDNEAFFKKLLD